MGALRSESPFSYFHCSTCASTASHWKRHPKRIPKVCSKWMNLIFDSWCISMERSVAQKVIKGKKTCHMCLQNFFLITHKLLKCEICNHRYVAIWGEKPDFRKNCMRKQNFNWESLLNGPFFILHTSLETTEWKVAFDEKIFSWLFCWHAIKLRWCSDALQCIMLWS